MSDQVTWELMTIANYLMIKNPEATFRDLLLLYFKHKTGVDYSKYL